VFHKFAAPRGPGPAASGRFAPSRGTLFHRSERPWGMRYAIWNGFVAAEVEHIHTPRDEEELSRLVQLARDTGRRLKAVGAGHSFNDLSLTDYVLVDLRQFTRLLSVDPHTRTVRVQGGMPLHVLVLALERMG